MAGILKRVGWAMVFAAGLAATPGWAQTDPLGPARQGQLQCYEPNTVAKTCQSIAGYTFAADGRIDNPADVLVVPDPLIVMRMSAPVTVRGDAVCGPLTRADISRAEFTINGAPASAEDTAGLREAVAEQIAPMLDIDVCTTFTQADDALRADVTFAGVARPELSQRVIWISPNDGYRIAP